MLERLSSAFGPERTMMRLPETVNLPTKPNLPVFDSNEQASWSMAMRDRGRVGKSC